MRNTVLNILNEYAKTNKNLMLLTGDLGAGALESFEEKYKDRFVNCGISEQNMIGTATGLALSGKKVVIYSIGNFDTLRVLEFIRNLVCYNNADVKIISIGAGVEYGPLGFTHHSTEDIACMNAMPNMKIFSPATKEECEVCTKAMLEDDGPCYLRLNKKGAEPEEIDEKISKKKNGKITYNYEVSDVCEAKKGKDGIIFATGPILREAMVGSKFLELMNGIKVAVFSVPVLKPINEEKIKKIIKNYTTIYTLEEHFTTGGLGSIMCDIVAKNGLNKKVIKLGLKEENLSFIGKQKSIRYKNDIGARSIYSRILKDLSVTKN
ncbi:MAG: transketolase [Clostridia bacterium]|nr:transketolase [Clostridia bacterium]